MSNEISTTVYTTLVAEQQEYSGPSMEAAIRTWDHATHDKARSVPGGIQVQSFNSEGIMVRDGWLLHVNPDGTCYLNPRIGA